MISVVVNSRNESKELDKCLNSVQGWADDLVVIDMQSSDNTREIAKKYKARVFGHPPVNYVEPVREFAVSKAKYGWVLILDPDEVVPERLKEKLSALLQKDGLAAVNIPRLNIFFGKKIKHTNFWPDRQIRFIRRGKVKFSNFIHSYPKVSGTVLDLPAVEDIAIHHYSYKSIKEYIERMKRYSTIEAINRFERGERFSMFNFFYMPLYDFIRRYIRHLGFLDGLVGFQLSVLQAFYYILVELKLLNLKK